LFHAYAYNRHCSGPGAEQGRSLGMRSRSREGDERRETKEGRHEEEWSVKSVKLPGSSCTRVCMWDLSWDVDR
jgi:hypothetical protein